MFFHRSLKMLHWFKRKDGTLYTKSDDSKDNTSLNSSVDYKNLGNMHLHNGDINAAEQCYRKALALQPDYAEACTNLGLVLKQRHLFTEAQYYLTRAISIKPELGRAHYHLGKIATEHNNLSDAIAYLYQAIRYEPDFEFAYLDLCHALFKEQQHKKGKEVIAKGIAVNPKSAQLHFYLGNLYFEEKNLEMAFSCLQEALTLQPNFAEAHNSLGAVFCAQGKKEQAIQAFQQALTINPDYVDARYNLGAVWQDQEKLDKAVACYRKVLHSTPHSPAVLSNLGNALLAQDKHGEAIEYYHKALAARPDYADAYSNLGIAHHSQGQFDEALRCYQQAISIQPEHADAHLNRGLLLLVNGKLQEGWPEYEYRWKRTHADPKPYFDKPLWLGQNPLSGKTILLYAEQGFGDTIQFSRYTKDVAALGATVFLQVQPSLKSLIENSQTDATIFTVGDTLPPFDYHCPLLSLPLAFQTDLASIPSTHPYVSASPAKTQYWSEQLKKHNLQRIGLVWSGNSKFKNDRNRSIPLQALSPLWKKKNGKYFFCLQKEIRDQDRYLLRDIPTITDLADQLIDFAETAAVIANLDLTITVDTAVAHLAGALGKPVWVLLPFIPDFRWLLNRTDSPWYPSVRLFRQPTLGDWESVIQDVSEALDFFQSTT